MAKKKYFNYCVVLLLIFTLFSCSAIASAAVRKVLTLKKTTMTVNVGSNKLLEINQNTTGKRAYFTSSNTSIATVNNNGFIIGIAEGEAVITVKAGTQVSKCYVTVIPVEILPTQILLNNQGKLILNQGESARNSITFEPIDASDSSLTYISSNPDIATVDYKSGLVTGVKEGKSIITIKAKNNVNAFFNVYVTDNVYMEIPNQKMQNNDCTLYLEVGHIKLGYSVADLEAELGKPGRIDNNEFGGQTYVYKSNYNSLLFVYVQDNIVQGYYTNADVFKCAAISNSITKSETEILLGGGSTWSVPGNYNMKVWFDNTANENPMAVLVTNSDFDYQNIARKNLFSANSELINNMELECIDLINGFRCKNGFTVLEYNPKASDVTRLQSAELLLFGYKMASNTTPEQRFQSWGISYNSIYEVSSSSMLYGITYDLSNLMGSDYARNRIFNNTVKYAGSGVAYGNGYTAEGIITVALFN